MRTRIGRLSAGATLSVLMAAAGGLFQSRADAATATASFLVTAAVSANCTISANPLTFGPYDPVVVNATTNLDVNSTLSVACTKGSTAAISMNLGTHASGAVRRMQHSVTATEFLTYELYTTGGRTTVWNTTNTVAYNATTKAASPVTVFGRVPSGQDIAVGNYSDSIVATITF